MWSRSMTEHQKRTTVHVVVCLLIFGFVITAYYFDNNIKLDEAKHYQSDL